MAKRRKPVLRARDRQLSCYDYCREYTEKAERFCKGKVSGSKRSKCEHYLRAESRCLYGCMSGRKGGTGSKIPAGWYYSHWKWLK